MGGRLFILGCLITSGLAHAGSMGGVGMLIDTAAPAVPTETTPIKPKRTLASVLSLESNAGTVNGSYGKPRGIFGDTPLTVGPKVTALGFPSPFRAGIEAKWDNTFGIGFDLGSLPPTGVANSRVAVTTYTGAVRYYPWRGPFYFGLGVGKQNIEGSRPASYSGYSYVVTVKADSILLAPQVGWRWVWESGFYLGLEAGLQVPLASNLNASTDAATFIKASEEYKVQLNNLEKQAKLLVDVPLPHFAVLQVGYFF